MDESSPFQTKKRLHWEDRGRTAAEDEEMGNTETGTITRVDAYMTGDGWSVTYDGWGCGVSSKWGVEPKIGDQFTTYGRFGRPFHGQALNGKILWYHSPEQQKADWEASAAESEAKRKREFADNMETMDADFDGLPPAFQARILRNRENNPDYRWESMGESYEVFTCQQAVILAEWARMDTSTPEEACAKIDTWNKINSKEHDPPYDYKAQLAAVPGWSDGHSGNTHGFAVAFAKAWIMGEKL